MKGFSGLLGRLGVTSRRSSVVAKNVVGSFVVQGAALILALFTLPAYIRFFENQLILGVWFTVLSVISWILNLDLGIGNGLRNRLVVALAKNDRAGARRYISSAYVIALGIVLFLGLSVAVSFRFIDWNGFLGVPTEVIEGGVLAETATIATIGILVQFALRLIVSVLYALQMSAVTGLVNLANSAGMLLVVLTMTSGSNSEKLILLAKASVVSTNLPLLVASVVVFSTILRDCSPRVGLFDGPLAWDVAKEGGKFFGLQVSYMLIVNTDAFLISRFAGPQYVVDYQIYSRFFFLFSSVFILALAPVWSAVTQAFAQGDLDWIERLYLRMRRMAFAALIGILSLWVSLQWLVDLWLGSNSIVVNMGYSLLFAVLSAEMIWIGVLSSVVNGLGRLRVQLLSYGIGALIKLPVALMATQGLASWVGIILATAIALLPYSILQPIRLNRYLTQLRLTSSPS